VITRLDTKKAHEGDVVELLEDFPEFNLARGQRGVVITEFNEPAEAYDIVVEDDAGNVLGLAYSVKPEQVTNLSGEAFERGLSHLTSGELAAAHKELRLALEYRPGYIGTLHNVILRTLGTPDDLDATIFYLRFITQLDPSYKHARNSLAIAYLNYGVEMAKKGHLQNSIILFSRGLTVESSPEIISKIKENIAATYHQHALQEHRTGNLENAQALMRLACSFFPDKRTRGNLAIASVLLAFNEMKRGRFQSAVSDFEEAEDAGLVSSELLNDYAIALVFCNKLEEAKLAFERALELRPESDVLKENLAKLMRNEAKEELIPEGIEVEDYIPVELYIPPAMQVSQFFHIAA
jgi:tetratricopeptide (TPR) repeat protein